MTPRQKSLAFFTLITGLVLEIVDVTIVNTALPAIQHDLGGNGAAAQWIVAGYALSFSMLLILGGRLGDLFGARAMFLLGVSGFTLASLACGAAGSGDQLIAARVIQGAAGAIMAPQVLTMIQLLYTPVERISRLAWFGVVGGLAAISGPILGGLLIAADVGGLGWRTVFLINGPVGLAAILAGWWLLPRHRAEPRGRIDLVGTALFGIALAAMFVPLVRGEHAAFDVGSAALLLGGVGLLVFTWRLLKRRAARGVPVVFDPTLLNDAVFRSGLGIAFSFAAANTGFLFLFAFTLQKLLGYTPLQAGLIHLPFSAGVMFGMAVLGRKLAARAGKWLIIGGVALLALFYGGTLAWIAAEGGPFWTLLPLVLVAGVGMGMVSGPIAPIAVSRVTPGHAGAASGILKTVQQIGGAFGVALAGGAFFAVGNERSLTPAILVIEALLAGCAVCAASLPHAIFTGRAAS
jgi:EmrB/QacA subfamily drug resistance transporter